MSEDPYPFESDDDIEIRELDLEDVDALAEARITVSQLAGEAESWRYGHVIVDEAQDLTPMQWRMVMRRVRGHSLTIVGDLAQRTSTAAASWSEVLPPEVDASATRQDLTINYRSPREIHDLATAVLSHFAPGVAPSRAIRTAGQAPVFHRVADSSDAVSRLVGEHLRDSEGLVAVLCAEPRRAGLASFDQEERVRVLTPIEAKGLEFDTVLLVEPDEIWRDGDGAAQLYIALTRATQRLDVVFERAVPSVLTEFT